jgi:hypothetical protein
VETFYIPATDLEGMNQMLRVTTDIDGDQEDRLRLALEIAHMAGYTTHNDFVFTEGEVGSSNKAAWNSISVNLTGGEETVTVRESQFMRKELQNLAQNLENAHMKHQKGWDWETHLSETVQQWYGQYAVGIIDTCTYLKGLENIKLSVSLINTLEK